MKFPQTIRHRKSEATIYGKSDHYPKYPLAYRVAGERRMRIFDSYTEAGNSPQTVHRNYKGIATRGEAEKWFSVMPTKAGNVVPLSADEID